MSEAKDRAERRARQSAEIESSQRDLRKSIAETERFVGDAEKMLKRRHVERADADSEPMEPAARPK